MATRRCNVREETRDLKVTADRSEAWVGRVGERQRKNKKQKEVYLSFRMYRMIERSDKNKRMSITIGWTGRMIGWTGWMIDNICESSDTLC